MTEYKLIQEIVTRSEANNWKTAKPEWELYRIYYAKQPQRCLCEHFPIMQICVLVNKINGRFAEIGNCCVKKFIGLPSDKIFQALKRAQKNIERSFNEETIQHAFKSTLINDWEYNFYIDIMGKRKLVPKQRNKKFQINRKILRKIMEGKEKHIHIESRLQVGK